MHSARPIIIFELPSSDLNPAYGDCACADHRVMSAVHKPTLPGKLHGNLVPASGLYRLPLNATYTLLFNLLDDSPCAVLNQAALEILDSLVPESPTHADPHTAQARQTLTTLGLLRPANSQPRAPVPSDTLVAWLHITHTCNLQCDYCYQSQSNLTMSSQIGQAAIDAIFRSAQAHGFLSVKLKYGGGEPTLHLRRLLSMQTQAIELADATGIELSSLVITNGVNLSAADISDLKKQDVTVVVSLDGLGHWHDAQRKFPNGRGSFELVAQSIERLVDAGHPPHISVTVTDRNTDGLAEMLAWILERNLSFNLNFYRETDCSAACTDLRLAEQRLSEALRRAFTAVEKNLPRFSLLGALLDRTHFTAQHRQACGAGTNYLAIAPAGGVAQCQMHLNRTVTDVQASDPLAAVQASNAWLRNVPAEDKEDCRDCRWRYWCAGGCPVETFRATGRWDVHSPHCHLYQSLFPEVLRLEGLRLLKHYSS